MSWLPVDQHRHLRLRRFLDRHQAEEFLAVASHDIAVEQRFVSIREVSSALEAAGSMVGENVTDISVQSRSR